MTPEQLRELLNTLIVTDKTSVNLSRLDIDDDQVIKISETLAKVPHIKEVDLSYNKIGSEGAKVLAANNTLTSLDLSSNVIGDYGAEALLKNETLKKLFIGDNHIHTEALKDLPNNLNLTTLSLQNNYIGDELPEVFRRGENAPKMNLSLANNSIGDEVAKVLANGNFSVLHLPHNYISDEVSQALQENVKANNLLLDLSYNNGTYSIINNYPDYRTITKLLHLVHPTNDIGHLIDSLKPAQYFYPLDEQITSETFEEDNTERGAVYPVAALLNTWHPQIWKGFDDMLCDVLSYFPDDATVVGEVA